MLSRLRRSSCAVLLAACAWAGSVQAAGIIRVTEAMSNALTLGDMDWWELTNYGDAPVDITGWKMDDNSLVFTSAVALVPFSTTGGPAWSVIDPGESVVFMEASSGSTAVPQFQALWNLGPGGLRNPKLGTYAGSGVGLSSGGDAVIIFDATGGEVSRVAFGAATTGRSFYWSYDSAGAIGSAPNAVSTAPLDFAYTVTATGATPRDNTGSPGIAVVTPPVVSLYWTANGTTLGGSGTWNAVTPRWSPTESPVAQGPWADGKAAIFAGTSGTVAVASTVSPLSITFATGGYTLASGTGSIVAGGVSVAGGNAATIATRLTGTTGLTVNGGTSVALNAGTLRLAGTGHDYTGFTSVVAGTLQAAAANVIPDASRLAVSRFTAADFNGFPDTVGGLQGLGTVRLGPTLTVSITGSSDARLDGTLSGTGDLVIDSVGTGVQRLNTSQQSLNEDFAVKDYVGRTIVRRGGLGVDRTAIPIATTEVTVEAAGRLLLSPSNDAPNQIFEFGSNAALPVSLQGGLIGQGPGDDVELANRLDVSGTGTVLIRNRTTPNPANPSTEQFTFSGPLTGPAGAVLKVLASDTTSGLAQSRAKFTSAGGNTFAGTVSPGPFAVARFNGDYTQTAVVLEGGKVDGYGAVAAVTGSGIVSPDGTNGADGILTVGTLTPTTALSFTFDLNLAGAAPEWATPTASGNDVLRLSAATPFASPLGSANVVRLFVGGSATPVAVAAGDTFQGGFFTSSNQQASIGGATYSTYVYGDGLGTDLEHGGSLYYTLTNFNQKQGTSLTPTVTMVPVTAGFADGTVSGFVMQTSFNTLDPNPATLTWYGDGVNPGGGGTWTTTGTTWFDGTTVRSWVPGAKAIFSGTGGTVTLDSGVAANGGLQFTSTGYTLTGAGLVLGGTSNGVEVGSGLSATVATVLSGSGG
ncbi:MAG: lamin tail domain-containing protein, partial [Planctomycetaceae bacterium]